MTKFFTSQAVHWITATLAAVNFVFTARADGVWDALPWGLLALANIELALLKPSVMETRR